MQIQKNRKYFFLFYMLGFLAGILYTNIVSADYVATMGIFNEYFLNQYVQTEVVVPELFWYILKVRVMPFLMMAMAGCLKIRKAVVVIFLAWTGFISGILITSAVMKMGIRGIIFCMIALMPHFLFYIVAYLILMWYLFFYPAFRWNMSQTMALILLFGMGIALECYVNPILMKMFIKTV